MGRRHNLPPQGAIFSGDKADKWIIITQAQAVKLAPTCRGLLNHNRDAQLRICILDDIELLRELRRVGA
ncbi:MAG: hypothetical protein HY000_23665 [Planctomycetes bacterium]|nr:hypothetical protein [Planctomycetota bacterium]